MALPFQIHSQKRIVQVECEFARNVNAIRQQMTSSRDSSYHQMIVDTRAR